MADAFAPSCHSVSGYADLYACERCGTVQQPDLPSGAELHDLYRDMRDDAYLAEEAGRRVTARRLLDAIERHAPRGRMLEVGCGHGLLLDEARARGWSVEGLELAAESREHARSLGLDVRDQTLEAAEGVYGAVVLADVLEHLDDPVGALRQIAALLAPGGVTLIVTPEVRLARRPPRRLALVGLPAVAHLPDPPLDAPRAAPRRRAGDWRSAISGARSASATGSRGWASDRRRCRAR